jgi:(R)-2-hydroxyacyl-CoA dehydratese activating ATPase
MGIAIGIDVGSVAAKAACIQNDKVVATVCMANQARYQDTVNRITEKLLKQLDLTADETVFTVACGYGRDMAQANGGTINEIIANVKGVLYQLNGGKPPRLIVNIGGQDIKVIFLDEDGNIDHFVFNDKCAAGTGRFFETLARILHLDVEKLSGKGQDTDPSIKITSTCVVFAENEIINLLARGFEAEKIIAAFNRAVAERIRNIAGGHDIPESVVVDGGVALNRSFIRNISDVFGRDIRILPQPQRTTAIGAARAAWERMNEKIS